MSLLRKHPKFPRIYTGLWRKKRHFLRENILSGTENLRKEKTRMNARNYYSIFKHEPDILTVPDVVRLLRMGKNTVYKLIKEGSINSIKQGKKIIIPKVCLVEFLLDQKNYQILSPVVPNNHWTCDGCCGSVGVAQESKVKNNKKGA